MDKTKPHIRPEVNRKEDEKRKAGVLAGLLGRGGPGGSGALGGLGNVGGVLRSLLNAIGLGGGSGGVGGAAGGVGLLATKTGILTLVFAAASLAGGVAMVGYRMFAAGESRGPEQSLSLFAAKPKDGFDPRALPPVPKDGTSRSLDFLAKANVEPDEPEEPAPPPDSGPAPAPAEQVAAAPTSGLTHTPSEAPSFTPKDTLGRKFGELSKGFGGSSPMSMSAAAKVSDMAAANQAAAKGVMSGFSRTRGAAGRGTRALANRHGSNRALRQAMQVRSDHRGASTSYGAGKTYDGSATHGGGVTGDGAAGSNIAGPGDSANPATSNPNTAIDKKGFEPPPEPTATEVTPWKKAIMVAQMLLGVGAMLLMMSSKIPDKTLKAIIAAIVAAIGAAVIALGAQIANGKYGQKLQGGVLAAAGAGLTAAALMSMMGGQAPGADGAASGATGAAPAGGAPAGGAPGGGEAGGGAMNPFVLLGGGAALLGIAGSMLMPPKKYPSTDFKNGRPPDLFFGQVTPAQTPAEKALQQFLV